MHKSDHFGQYREAYIYVLMFVNEFTYFFLLPYLSISQSSEPLIIGGVLAVSTLLESLVMLAVTSRVRRISASTVFMLGSALMVVAWALLIIFPGLGGICLFYALMSISKGTGKPYARSVLLKVVPTTHHDRVFPNISFVQNAAIVVAPLAGGLAIALGEVTFLFPALVYILLLGLAWMLFIHSQIVIRSSGGGFPAGLAELAQSRLIRSSGISICLAYVVMGLYITGTVLLREYNPELSPYVEAFFSVVGITIIVWQGVLRRWVPSGIQTSSMVLLSIVALSSLFFVSNPPLAFAALVLYAIYESIVIPLNYKAASAGVSDTLHSLVFSFFLVSANIGEAIGSLTAGAVVSFGVTPAIVLSASVMIAACGSIMLLKLAARAGR